MGFCICSMFCCALPYVHFNFSVILVGKRELVAFLNLSSWCLLIVVRLFISVTLVCLQFVRVINMIILTIFNKYIFTVNQF